MSVGRETIGHAVDSSAIICTSGCVGVDVAVQPPQELDRVEFSRPPCSFGIHSPSRRE